MKHEDLITYLKSEGCTPTDCADIPNEGELSGAVVLEICNSLDVVPPWQSIPIQTRICPPFRDCSFCLSLQSDSVFSDFAIDADNNVSLVRISFDGYGCCEIEKPPRMNSVDAKVLMTMLAENELDSKAASDILRRYFKRAGSKIWLDAISEYGLVDCSTDCDQARDLRIKKR